MRIQRKKTIASTLYRVAIIAALLLLAPFARTAEDETPATDAQALLAEATELFRRGVELERTTPQEARENFLGAALRYRKLLEGGRSNGALHYNLGNCHMRLGQLGQAILEYRRAQIHTPHDPNLLHNLAAARGKRQDKIAEKEEARIVHTLLFWHYDLSYRTRQIIFAVCFLGFWGLLAARLMLPVAKRTGLAPLLITGVLSAAMLASLIAQPLQARANRDGVITTPETTARKGDGESYPPAFTSPLHEGTEFTLMGSRAGWYEIELADGRRCWIPAAAAGLVRPADD